MSRAVMLWCKACKDYTLHPQCHRCGSAAQPNRPAKFSPEDQYGAYRRRLKQLERGR